MKLTKASLILAVVSNFSSTAFAGGNSRTRCDIYVSVDLDASIYGTTWNLKDSDGNIILVGDNTKPKDNIRDSAGFVGYELSPGTGTYLCEEECFELTVNNQQEGKCPYNLYIDGDLTLSGGDKRCKISELVCIGGAGPSIKNTPTSSPTKCYKYVQVKTFYGTRKKKVPCDDWDFGNQWTDSPTEFPTDSPTEFPTPENDNECICKDSWWYNESGCRTGQNGCPDKACDGWDGGPWCIVTDKNCDTVERSTSSGSEVFWSKCDPDDGTASGGDTECTPCTNEPSPGMVWNGLTCDDWEVSQRCQKKSANWRNNRYCEKSCYDLGYPYDKDVKCCKPVWNPQSPPTKAPTFKTSSQGDDCYVEVQLMTDKHPTENSFVVEKIEKNGAKELVFAGNGFTEQYRNYNSGQRVEAGNYVFTIYDKYEDGMVGGEFAVLVNGEEVGSGQGDFGAESTIKFSCNGNNSSASGKGYCSYKGIKVKEGVWFEGGTHTCLCKNSSWTECERNK